MVSSTGGDAATEHAPEPHVSVMRTPAVRRMVVTYGFSALGSAMVAVAMAFVAYRESGSVVLTVLVLGANAAPALVLSPVVGKLAARRDPRTVEAIGQAAKVVLSVVLTVVAASGALSYPVLLVANVANGIVSALIAPAWPRIARMSAPKGRLTEVTASLSSVGSVAAIVGALAGGLVVAAIGSAWVFAINALSYVPLIVAVRMVPGTPPESHVARRTVRGASRWSAAPMRSAAPSCSPRS